MKPLDRRQQVPLAIGAVALLAAGALAWWGLGSLGEKQVEVQALAERMGNPALAALLADPAGVAGANREAVEIQKLEKELREGEGLLLSGWATETAKLAGEGQDWSSDPGKWKDRLVAIQSELQKKASGQRVQLAPDFYLGLDPFRQRSPTAPEVPGLALHLSVAERLVELLFRARQVPEQYPTACEFRLLSGPGSAAEKAPDASAPGARPAQVPERERKAFRVEIRCSPEVLYEYVRLLSTDPALFIITDLSVTNEKQTFPLRSEIAKKFTSPEGGLSGSGQEKKKLLEILAGEECLLAALEVDFVVWRKTEEGKPPAGSAGKP